MSNRKQEDETSDCDFSQDEKVSFRGKKQENKNVQQKEEKKKPELVKKDNQPPKRSNFVTRTIYTLLMLFGFFSIIAAGPFYSVILVLFLSAMMFNELLSLKRSKDKERDAIPYFHFLNWYFYIISVYFAFGRLIQAKLPQIIFQNDLLYYLSRYHNVHFFLAWVAGFVIFTLSLKQGYYKYQIRQFGWTHIGCFFLVGATSVMQLNIYEGMVWFLLPVTLVIANDIFAYIFGFFLGTHKLIALSPKKTWEGFIGGAVCSVIWAFFISLLATYLPQLVCPQRTFNIIPFSFEDCQYPDFYVFYQVDVPSFLQGILGQTMNINDFSLHAMVLSCFASLIAPFGGFFASGLKRALKIKDFGDVIPGHGGLIDRFDCQLIMAMFSYVYIHNVVLGPQSAVGTIIQHLNTLEPESQLAIFNQLKENLTNSGILN